MRIKWEEKHVNYLKDIYKGRYGSETAKLFNEKFGTNVSKYAIIGKLRTLGLRTGNPPRATKESHKCIQRPIGAKRVENGYVHIKVDDKFRNDSKNWKLYNRYLWEKYYGDIPENHVIIFLNNNNRDFRIENLQAIPRSIYQMMVINNLIYDDPELTKTGINIAKLLKNQTKRSVRRRN